MTQPTIIPKPRKRKRQPTAEMMREQLRLAADEIIRLRTPWYRRLFARTPKSQPSSWRLPP